MTVWCICLSSTILTWTMMLSLDAASWASFTQRLTTSKLHFSRCWGQWDLLKGQKEGYPSCHTHVPSEMQSEPPHCPDPMDKQHSCHPHSPCLADFLPNPGPNNLPSKGVGVSKTLNPALPSGPRVSGSLLTRLSVYSTFNPHPCRSQSQLHTREDTRAELETLGTLSTIACFM